MSQKGDVIGWEMEKSKSSRLRRLGFLTSLRELARSSGFLGVLDLLKVAKHGKGDNIYLIPISLYPRRKQTEWPKNQVSLTEVSPKSWTGGPLLTLEECLRH